MPKKTNKKNKAKQKNKQNKKKQSKKNKQNEQKNKTNKNEKQIQKTQLDIAILTNVAYYHLGLYKNNSDQKYLDVALSIFRDAIKLDGGDIFALCGVAIIKIIKKQYIEAWSLLYKIGVINPWACAPYYHKTYLYYLSSAGKYNLNEAKHMESYWNSGWKYFIEKEVIQPSFKGLKPYKGTEKKIFITKTAVVVKREQLSSTGKAPQIISEYQIPIFNFYDANNQSNYEFSQHFLQHNINDLILMIEKYNEEYDENYKFPAHKSVGNIEELFKEMSQTNVDDCSLPKELPISEDNEEGNESESEQTGWNCFDIAVKLFTKNTTPDRSPEATRKLFVDYVLANIDNDYFRSQLAPEIHHAALLTATNSNDDDALLPEAMRTEEVHKIFSGYQEGTVKRDNALRECNNLLNPTQPLTLNALTEYFSTISTDAHKNNPILREAYKYYKEAVVDDNEVKKWEKNIDIYCKAKETCITVNASKFARNSC